MGKQTSLDILQEYAKGDPEAVKLVSELTALSTQLMPTESYMFSPVHPIDNDLKLINAPSVK